MPGQKGLTTETSPAASQTFPIEFVEIIEPMAYTRSTENPHIEKHLIEPDAIGPPELN
ncbi:hypothetical protein ACFL6N_02695 [Thermodesulfobacteriota bacterium]